MGSSRHCVVALGCPIRSRCESADVAPTIRLCVGPTWVFGVPRVWEKIQAQLDKIRNEDGFIAALDQSGGSTPKALKLYGVGEDAYSNDEEMFAAVHAMRTRIITSKSFTPSGPAT